MNLDFQRLMHEASRLTQGGDLQAATAAIQAALGATAVSPAQRQDDAIDVDFRVVGEAPAPGMERPAPRPPADTPDPGRILAGSHAGASGQRDYKLYVPPATGPRPLPRPLVVMLHGCTQDPDDFAAGTAMNALALRDGFFVLYPAQSSQANPQRCWNWFKHTHQTRDRGEPALLAGMTRQVMAAHAIDPERVYVAGLSAGGAMAAILGDAYPDLFAAVGVHSGLAAGAASDLPSALAAMRGGGAGRRGLPSGVPTIAFHGDADSTVHPDNGHQVVAASVGTTAAVETERVQGVGRSSTRCVYRAADGRVLAEHWQVHGAAHAWSGGSAAGSYTDGRGPDASAEMLRFFSLHTRRAGH